MKNKKSVAYNHQKKKKNHAVSTISNMKRGKEPFWKKKMAGLHKMLAGLPDFGVQVAPPDYLVLPGTVQP